MQWFDLVSYNAKIVNPAYDLVADSMLMRSNSYSR